VTLAMRVATGIELRLCRFAAVLSVPVSEGSPGPGDGCLDQLTASIDGASPLQILIEAKPN